ncbi:hypothetical protein ACHAWF_000732, partial [Thalassiosira exigua]
MPRRAPRRLRTREAAVPRGCGRGRPGHGEPRTPRRPKTTGRGSACATSWAVIGAAPPPPWPSRGWDGKRAGRGSWSSERSGAERSGGGGLGGGGAIHLHGNVVLTPGEGRARPGPDRAPNRIRDESHLVAHEESDRRRGEVRDCPSPDPAERKKKKKVKPPRDLRPRRGDRLAVRAGFGVVTWAALAWIVLALRSSVGPGARPVEGLEGGEDEDGIFSTIDLAYTNEEGEDGVAHVALSNQYNYVDEWGEPYYRIQVCAADEMDASSNWCFRQRCNDNMDCQIGNSVDELFENPERYLGYISYDSSHCSHCLGNHESCGCFNVLQADYRGSISKTASGIECQQWSHPYSRNRPEDHPFSHLEQNFCRNPDDKFKGAWCYTHHLDGTWEYCNVPVCGRNEAAMYDYWGIPQPSSQPSISGRPSVRPS